MSALQPFTFPATGQTIRTVTIDGEPWLVGRDVALALGYANPRDAIAKHVPDRHKGESRFATPSGNQDLRIISEPGMYRLIMRSNTELAEPFQEWVTAEVLPAIRRTGTYSASSAPRLPDLNTPEGVLALAEKFTETARALVESDRRVKELEPKAVAHDQFLTAGKGDRLVREVAKLLGWKERDLRAFLLDERLIFRKQATCGNYQYDVYARHIDHFKPVEKVVEHTWGACSHYTLYIRPSGVDLIQRRIERQRTSIQQSIGGA